MNCVARGAAFAVGAVVVGLALGGCIEKSPLFGGKTPPPEQPAALPPEPPPVPYRMTARASGPTVEFTIVNDGEGEILVSPKDFALIPSGTRRVVPYNQENVTIDVPARVPAKGRVSGRAIFKEFPTPTGHRLVFKPDERGTYAQIVGLF